MTDTAQTTPAQPTGGEKARIVNHYIKSLQFETPNMAELLGNRTDAPDVNVELSVAASQLKGNFYESTTQLQVKTTGTAGTIYELDIVHASLVELHELPQASMERALLLEVPRQGFPFLRRLVADLTRESGFPPLLLDPVDFSSIYASRRPVDGPEVIAAE